MAETFSIAVAAERSGMTPRQIRYLEDRGLIRPDYIQIGQTQHRRYTPNLVELLAQIASLRENGYTLAAAVRLANGKNL